MSDSISLCENDKPFEPKGDPLPQRSGSQALPKNKPYYLKLEYVDDNGKVQSGFAYFVGNQASWSFWDYMSATPSNGDKAVFKNVSSDGGRMQLELQDGNYLSCRAAPRLWLYRSTAAYSVRWEIVNGQLFTDYHEGPVGTSHERVAVPDAYYMRVGGTPLRNCEWVEAPN
ncbi:hypothetical protein [Pseudomonas graminis]